MYDAFVSYSHAADGRLAPAIQSALEKFARPLFRRRALHIFRDETNLSATPHLWDSIIESLSQARWFILLASPEAAKSKWVKREIEWWLSNRDPDHLLLVLTDGTIRWDDHINDFDWHKSDGLPAVLKGRFKSEPMHVDLSWAKKDANLSLRHVSFRSDVLKIAARLRGVPPDELDGEAVRVEKRNRLIWISGAVLLLIAALLTGRSAYKERQARVAEIKARETAEIERDKAVHLSQLALSRQLSASAERLYDDRYDLSMLLAVQAYQSAPTLESERILLQGTKTRRIERFLYGHSGPVIALVFIAGKKNLATSGTDGKIILWDTGSGKPVKEMVWEAEVPIPSLAYDPNSGRLAAGNNKGEIMAWDLATGAAVFEKPVKAHATFVRRLAFDTHGDTLVSASMDGEFGLWNARDGSAVRSPAPLDNIKSNGAVALDVYFEGLLAAVAGVDRRIGVSDFFNGQTLVSHDFVEEKGGSGQSGGASSFYNVETGEPISLAQIAEWLPSKSIVGLAVSEWMHTLAIARANQSVQLWDLEEQRDLELNDQEVKLDPARGRIIDLAFYPRKASLYAATAEGVVKWSIGSRLNSPFSLPGQSTMTVGIAFNPADDLIASGHADGTVILWNEHTKKGNIDVFAETEVRGLNFDALVSKVTGSTIPFGQYHTVEIWDSETGKRIRENEIQALDSSDEIKGLAISADSKKIAIGTRYGHLFLLDADAQQSPPKLLSRAAKREEASPLAFAPNGAILAKGTYGRIEIIDTSTGNLLGRPLVKKKDLWADSLAFSSDGRLLVAGYEDREIVVWNLQNGSPILDKPLAGHLGKVSSVLFMSDDQKILSGDNKGNIILWDVLKGDRLAHAKAGDAPIIAFSLANEGRRIVSASMDGLVSVWTTDTLERLYDPLDPNRGALGVILNKDGSRAILLFKEGGGAGSDMVQLSKINLAPSSWAATVCDRVARELTKTEWDRFVGTEWPYRSACRD